jgi:hypothetical protein
VEICGVLGAISMRTALQYLAFAAGAYVTCSRSKVLKILQTKSTLHSTDSDAIIPDSEQGLDRNVEVSTAVTAVNVTASTYTFGTSVVKVFNGHLDPGTYWFKYSQPLYDVTKTVGPAITLGFYAYTNYLRVVISTAGTYTFSGKAFEKDAAVYSVQNPDESLTSNILSVEGVSLVGPVAAQAAALRLYNYYQRRYTQTLEVYASLIKPGDIALLDTVFGTQLLGAVESVSTDLVNGMIGQVKVVGEQNVLD